jgi:hypothetical protein
MGPMTSDLGPRKLGDFDAKIDSLDNARAREIEHIAAAIDSRHALMVFQADWHLRGLVYHLRRMRELYEAATKNVGDMAAGDPAGNIMVSTSPAMQQLMFEFYAFISLARVTLDQLIRFSAPSLKLESGQLPKSITDVLKWKTDFPPFVDLQGRHRPLVQYLIDIRDCIVHHRTFATNEGMVAVEEGFPEEKVPEMPARWARTVVRTSFRRLGGRSVSVNVLLPNAIYSYKATGERDLILKEFSYGDVNLLTQCREFAKLCTAAVLQTLALVAEGKSYELRKRGRESS